MVIVLNAAYSCFEPRREGVSIADELGIGIGDQNRARAGEPLLQRQLERMIDAAVRSLAGKLDAGVLGIGSKQLPGRGGGSGQSQRFPIDEKRIRD